LHEVTNGLFEVFEVLDADGPLTVKARVTQVTSSKLSSWLMASRSGLMSFLEPSLVKEEEEEVRSLPAPSSWSWKRSRSKLSQNVRKKKILIFS
jgi:hypothetical protein